MQPDACSSLYILIKVYLLLRIASEESRCATGSLVTDIEFITDRMEAPFTWLVELGGTSSSEFPWSVILEQLRGDGGSNHELQKCLLKCGSVIPQDLQFNASSSNYPHHPSLEVVIVRVIVKHVSLAKPLPVLQISTFAAPLRPSFCASSPHVPSDSSAHHANQRFQPL